MALRGPGGSIAAAGNPGGMTGGSGTNRNASSGSNALGNTKKSKLNQTFGAGFTTDLSVNHAVDPTSGQSTDAGPTGLRSPDLGKTSAVGGGGILAETLKKKQLANGQVTPETDAQKALDEAGRQRDLQSPFVKGATTVMGLLPGPVMPGMGQAMALGNYMGKKSEEALRTEEALHPGTIKTNPNDPGAVSGRINGMMYSNRADVPGYNGTNGPRGLGRQAGNTDLSLGNVNKRKKVSTVLSTPALGTTSNPMGIA